MKIINKALKLQGTLDMMGYGMYVLKAKYWEQRSLRSKMVEDFLNKNYPKYKFSRTNFKQNVKLYEKNYRKSAKTYILNNKIANILNIEKLEDNNYYLKCNKENAKTMLYVYGSGFWQEISNFQWYFLRTLADNLEVNIIVLNQKFAPYYDYYQVIEDLDNLYKDYKSKINYVAADGSGATLLYNLLNNQEDVSNIDKMILFSPIINLDFDTTIINKEDPVIDSYSLKVQTEYFFNKDYEKAMLHSPYHMKLKDMPDTIIISGGKDTLNKDIINFYNKQVYYKKDIELWNYDHMIHNFQFFPLSETKEVLNKLCDVFNSNIQKPLETKE
ncbi:alpha/beta hydrolase [Mycoplasma sp. P36-A1]|uniref:alpha/beta hydrolase n=1 Tax=Mycoplasma sp. P36-A1 TaxID=3252900 RepID=UPI003C2AF7D9